MCHIDDCCHEAAVENNNMRRKRNNALSSSIDTSDTTSISSGLDENDIMDSVRQRRRNIDMTHSSECYYSQPSHRKSLSRIIRRRTSDVSISMDSCSSCPPLRRLSTEEMSSSTNNIIDNIFINTPKRRGRRRSSEPFPPSPRTPSPSSSSKSTLQSSTQHLSNFILKSLLLTVFITSSIHYYTYTNLRYNLHYLGMYNIRGVVGFKSNNYKDATVKTISRVGIHSTKKTKETQGEEDPQEYDIPMTTHSTIPNQDPQETTTTLPLMLSRNYVARSGTSNTSYDIPRGTPLPQPMLTLLNVNICAVATSVDDCYGVSRGGNGNLLECTWCPQTSTSSEIDSANNQDENKGGKCVPKDMRGVMCT